MNRFLQSSVAPALIWLAVSLTVVTVSVSDAGSLGLAVLAAACVAVLPGPTRIRISSALAMIPVAIPGAPTWSFVLAGGFLAASLSLRAPGASATPLERIQRHLEWCRRRGEPAHLLWVHTSDLDRETALAAMECFRVTDNAVLLQEGEGAAEIVAMVDDASFERAGLESRLRARIGDSAGFGWAVFPEDGVTLEALFQQARAAAVVSSADSFEPDAQLFASIRRWGNMSPTRAAARSPNRG